MIKLHISYDSQQVYQYFTNTSIFERSILIFHKYRSVSIFYKYINVLYSKQVYQYSK